MLNPPIALARFRDWAGDEDEGLILIVVITLAAISFMGGPGARAREIDPKESKAG